MILHRVFIRRPLVAALALVTASCAISEPPIEGLEPEAGAEVEADVDRIDCGLAVNLFAHPSECDGVALASARDGVAIALSLDYLQVIGISADGTRVAFLTETALKDLGDVDGGADAYVVDLGTGTWELATPSSVPAGFRKRMLPSWGSRGLSDDGNLVVIRTLEALQALEDTNNKVDVYVSDLSIPAISRASLRSDGTQTIENASSESISRAGRHVSFASAEGLVAADDEGRQDVFLHDRETGLLVRVSEAPDGSGGNAASSLSAVDDSGRFVAFQSSASNLVDGDTNGVDDIFVKDLATGAVERVSVSSEGEQANGNSFVPDISADGRYVVFVSYASNLVGDDSNASGDVFRHDRETGETIRVSVRSDGTEQASGGNWPRVSADGSRAVFVSQSFNLVPDSTGKLNVYVHDVPTGETRLVSKGLPAQAQVGSISHISADGRYAAFSTDYGDGPGIYVAPLDP